MSETHVEGAELPASPRTIFKGLILYRWISLLPPLVTLLAPNGERAEAWPLLMAISATLFISIFSDIAVQALRSRSWLLSLDLLLMAGLVALSGGWQSPYFLHTLSPLLVAAFFFNLSGALWSATALLPLYVAGVWVASEVGGDAIEWLSVTTNLVGFYLIGGAFGYASVLVNRLRTTGGSLVDAHRDLTVIHDLTLSLQSAADVDEVQERVLEAVTDNLGFKQAVVGLVDPDRNVITGWLGRVQGGQLLAKGGSPHLMQVPIAANGGAVAEALLDLNIRQITSRPLDPDHWIATQFDMQSFRIFPMMLRDHAVGVLLVDATGMREGSARLYSLESIARQAAVAIGTTMLCINRAQRLAVQDERLRIAQDIHDTLSQSLFGIVYTLDGSLGYLPDHPEVAIPELKRALRVAEEAHQEVRQSILDIWPSELTAERFANGLQQYTTDVCRPGNLELSFDISAEFDGLSSQARRGLYRIAQEALTNAAHHASARQVNVRLEVNETRVSMEVTDDGCGFVPETAMMRDYDRERFGLRGMVERAQSLDGDIEIRSQPGQGTTVAVEIANG